MIKPWSLTQAVVGSDNPFGFYKYFFHSIRWIQWEHLGKTHPQGCWVWNITASASVMLLLSLFTRNCSYTGILYSITIVPRIQNLTVWDYFLIYMSHFAYACKTEGKNGISCLISTLCINCLISILEYSRLNHLDVHLVWTTSETSQN